MAADHEVTNSRDDEIRWPARLCTVTASDESGSGLLPQVEHAYALEALQDIALHISSERTVDGVLRRIVEGLSEQAERRLGSGWVVGSGDLCESCNVRSLCAESNGMPAFGGERRHVAQWRVLVPHRRTIPTDTFWTAQGGSIAAEHTGLLLPDSHSEWWARPEWVQVKRFRASRASRSFFETKSLAC